LKYLWKLFITDIWEKYRFRIVLLLFLMVINSFVDGIGLAMLLPFLSMLGIGDKTDNKLTHLINSIFERYGFTFNLANLIILIIFMFFIQNIVYLIQTWFAAKLQTDYLAQWRKKLFYKYIMAGWPFFVINKVGNLTNILITETQRLSSAFYLNFQIISSTIISFIIYTALSFYLSWQITLSVFVVSILLFFITRGFVKKGYLIGKEITFFNKEFQVLLTEFIVGAKVIKATATEDFAYRKIRSIINKLANLYFLSSFYPYVSKSLFEFSAISLILFLFYIGTQMFNINSASIIVVTAVFVKLVPKLYSLQQNLQILGVYLPTIETIKTSFIQANQYEEKYDENDVNYKEELCSAVDIRINNLKFAYNNVPILTNITMNFQAGKIIGIIGASGSGKSTLVDCLLRLVDTEHAAITINGIPIRDLPLRLWRKAVGYVPQDSFLFNDTIKNNILWGVKDDFCEEKMIEAAKKAYIHDFIMSLPLRYDTIVGDRGIRLSGGQKQRIGLARALVNDPILLVLDEATSALDSESEKAVLEAISKLRGKITIVTIAHRLSAVAYADYIYVMDNGAIIEEGTWEQLMKNGNKFKELLNIQNTAQEK